jgi:hypothetical protein
LIDWCDAQVQVFVAAGSGANYVFSIADKVRMGVRMYLQWNSTEHIRK